MSLRLSINLISSELLFDPTSIWLILSGVRALNWWSHNLHLQPFMMCYRSKKRVVPSCIIHWDSIVRSIPVTDKLMVARIIWTHMYFGQLPEPEICGIFSRSENSLTAFSTWSGWWQAKFYCNRLQHSIMVQEEQGACCVCLATLQGIDLVDVRHVYIMVV